MITTWHILISGFTQTLGKDNGMSKLWRDMRHLSGPDTCVQLVVWNIDWNDFARFIKNNSSGDAIVRVYAYSWGAGWGAQRLSAQLYDLCVGIEYMVLCDPVFRTTWLPDWFNFAPRSIFGKQKIEYAPSVSSIDWFYQRQNKPCGHEPVILNNPFGYVSEGIELKYNHEDMEDSPEFHKHAIQVASRTRSLPSAAV